MGDLSVIGLLFRFLLGGSAVLASTLVARRLGEKAGGIFAAFPAVYLAALLTNRIDYKGEMLITHSILLSKGAMIGMGINILIAIIAGYVLQRHGWKLGLVQTVVCWFVVSIMVVLVTSHTF